MNISPVNYTSPEFKHFGEQDSKNTYSKGQKEVTYVYDLTILPPQTGVEANMFMYVNYIFALIALAVAFRTYKTIKNN